MRRAMGCACCWLLAGPLAANAQEGGAGATGTAPGCGPDGTASFVLSIGVNRGVDTDLPGLRYADDDAARSFELFRLLGAQVVLLASLDAATSALHPQAQGEARPATRRELVAAAEALAAQVRQAKARGLHTTFTLVFAGHGNLREGRGYLVLEDARLSGLQLAELVKKVGADRSHLIVDACASFFLAFARGPGGERRALAGFHELTGLRAEDGVGLLLSGSTVRESHEWEGFQAGVFSHEVRSGLFGAADADVDGRVSYREIAAFVESANAAIPNERFRPQVYARPPAGSDVLADLPGGGFRRLSLEGAADARYYLEDARGVRLLDVHPLAEKPVRLLLPAPSGTLYLHRQGGGGEDAGAEFPIPPGAEAVSFGSLSQEPARAQERGAAHEAFSRLFAKAFGPEQAAAYRFAQDETVAGVLEEGQPPRLKTAVGWGALGLSLALAGTGVGMTAWATDLRAGATAQESQLQIATRNERIRDRNLAAGVLYGAAGVALTGGLLLLLWPDGDGAGIGFGGDGPLFTLSGRF